MAQQEAPAFKDGWEEKDGGPCPEPSCDGRLRTNLFEAFGRGRGGQEVGDGTCDKCGKKSRITQFS